MKKILSSALKVLVRIILIFQTIIIIYPLIWTFYSSLKQPLDFYFSPWMLPTKLNFINYYNAFTKASIPNNFLNSFIVVGTTMVLTLVFATTAAYILTRYRFFGSRFISKMFTISMFLPGLVALIPIFLLVKNLGLYNRILALIFLYTAANIPFTLFVLSGYFKTLEGSYEESAFIDGCSTLKTYWMIVFPLMKPAILTVMLMNFINNWNEFNFAFLLISDTRKRTLTAGLVDLFEVQRFATDWGALYAALIIVMVPVIVFYLIFQKRLISGMTEGAVKG